MPAGMAVRQRHLANGSVELAVDALLLPPPLPAASSQQAAAAAPAGDSSAPSSAQQAERGTLLLQLASPDGSQHWQSTLDVTSLPTDAAAAAAACGGGDISSSSGSSCPWPWPLLSASGGSEAGGAEGGGVPAVPPPAKHSLSIMLDSPQLWWTHDLGPQPLYTLQLSYQASSGRQGSAPAAEALPPAEESGPGGSGGGSQALARRIGLRRIELVTQPLHPTQEGATGSNGVTFFFRVNGQPLYARGAVPSVSTTVPCCAAVLMTNWVPCAWGSYARMHRARIPGTSRA